MGRLETSPSAEKVTRLEPVSFSARCQLLSSLYPRKVLGKQVGSSEPPQPLLCCMEDPGAHSWGDAGNKHHRTRGAWAPLSG